LRHRASVRTSGWPSSAPECTDPTNVGEPFAGRATPGPNGTGACPCWHGLTSRARRGVSERVMVVAHFFETGPAGRRSTLGPDRVEVRRERMLKNGRPARAGWPAQGHRLRIDRKGLGGGHVRGSARGGPRAFPTGRSRHCPTETGRGSASHGRRRKVESFLLERGLDRSPVCRAAGDRGL